MSQDGSDSHLHPEDNDDDYGIDPAEVVKVIDLDNNDQDGNGESDEEEDEMETDEGSASASGPLEDNSQRTFTGHRDSSVISVRLSPVTPDIAITGGQDDRAFVWNTKDGSILFECTGHTDTVASVGFSFDGSMVASADMQGLIKVWKVETGAEIWSFEVSEVEWIQWHQAAPVLVAGSKDGQVWMWKVPSGDCKTFAGFGPSALCGHILPDGKHAAVAYEDGVVKIWDLKTTEAVHTLSGRDGHKDSVFCLDNNPNGSLIMTGSGDMTSKIINTVTGKVVSTFDCQGKEEEDSVETVAFSHTHDYAVTGTLSGQLNIWDLSSKSVRHRCEHPYGIVKVVFSKNSPAFYASCLDGNLRQFDSRNGQLVRTWQGHRAAVLDFDLARDESIIVTASDDSTAKIFSLSDLGRT